MREFSKKTKMLARRFSQALFIFIFFYLLDRSDGFPLPEKLPLGFFFRMDGLLALFSSVSTGHFAVYFMPSAVLMALLVMRGNFFCYWICPVGGLIDFGNIVVVRRKWRSGIRVPAFVRKIRLFLLAGFLLTALAALFVEVPNLFWPSDPFVIITRAFVLGKGWMILFAIILAASIAVPRIWCNCICPLGCLYHYLGRAGRAGLFKKRKK